MPLILEVISYKGARPAMPLNASFDEGGGTIGRSFDNRLTLQDDEKVVSRHHGNIRHQNGVFVYADSSTGGTLLVQENRLLENGEQVTLHDGDRLKLGEYELLVKLESGGAAPAFPTDFQGLGETPGFAGQLGGGFDLSVPPLFHEEPPLPLRSPGLPATAPAAHDSFLGQPDVSPFHENFTPPGVQGFPDDFSFDDLLGASPTPSATPPPSAATTGDSGLDWLGDLGLDMDTPAQAAPPSPDVTVARPAAPPPLPESPPHNADDPFAADAQLQPAPGNPFAPELPAQAVSSPPFTDGLSTLSAVNPSTAPPPFPFELEAAGAPLVARPTPPSDVPVALNLPQPGRPLPPKAPVFAPPPEPPPAPPPLPTPPPVAPMAAAPSVAPAPPPTDATDYFACFLEGAGLTDFPKLSVAEKAEAMKALGIVYREMIDGMMMVLRARAEEKREIRTDVTIIRKEKNNPLKFIPTVEDAMKVMVSRKFAGYIDSTEAVREGFSDIMKHQLAMRAGMQAAVSEILKRFDPAYFDNPPAGKGLFGKKDKPWEVYGKAYPNLVADAMEKLFGETFAKAYEDQMKQLRDMPS